MGYTNYFTVKDDIKIKNVSDKDIETEYTAAKQEMRQLIQYFQINKRNIVLDYHYNPEYILFNGDPSKNEDHETFYLPETFERFANYFSFCKTCRKPYDQVVVACISLLKSHLYNIVNISSDGYDETNKTFDDEILIGYKLYKEFKKQSINPFTLSLKKLFV